MTRLEQIQKEREERAYKEETKEMKKILRNYLSKNNIKILEEELKFSLTGQGKTFICKTNNSTYRIKNVIGYRNRGIYMKRYFSMYREENGKSKRIPKKEW